VANPAHRWDRSRAPPHRPDLEAVPDRAGPRHSRGRLRPRGHRVLAADLRPDRHRARQAATFYNGLAGWNFDPIGRDKDTLFVRNGPPVGTRAASKAPDGPGGTVQFHISVPDHQRINEAIQDLGGHVGQERAAGIFSTRACTDDQNTAFSLWYQPARTPNP
jgi:predicted enzyme related to lactoylglutathione lyase